MDEGLLSNSKSPEVSPISRLAIAEVIAEVRVDIWVECVERGFGQARRSNSAQGAKAWGGVYLGSVGKEGSVVAVDPGSREAT